LALDLLAFGVSAWRFVKQPRHQIIDPFRNTRFRQRVADEFSCALELNGPRQLKGRSYLFRCCSGSGEIVMKCNGRIKARNWKREDYLVKVTRTESAT
jgi:hypothetical protein